jgi:DNA-binding beta-propeller fold protein YncE
MKTLLLIVLTVPLIIAQSSTTWLKVDSVSANNPYSAHYNPIDEAVYFVQRNSSKDGVYKYSADSGLVFICSADRPSAVFIDLRDGDIFHSEDYSGSIFYTPFDTTGRITWVSGLHSGDDDPVGMAIVPENFNGRGLIPGQVLVADRGYSGQDEIWVFSADSAQNEWPLHTDNGTLINPLDVAITDSIVYVVDEGEEKGGRIFEVDSGGVLTRLILNDTLMSPTGLTYDPVSGDLYVLDYLGSVLGVNPLNGNVTEIMSGFKSSKWNWCGIDISPDGEYLIITENVAGHIYILQRMVSTVDGNNQDLFVFELKQNYPNPFNNSTIIKYSIPREGLLTLKVYSLLGEEIALLVNETKATGNYEVAFNAANLPSGIYFYQLKSGDYINTKKMILLK